MPKRERHRETETERDRERQRHKETETQRETGLDWTGLDGLLYMSNIAFLTMKKRKKKKKKKKKKKEANNEPKRAINEMQTETREEKKGKKISTSRGFRDSFNVRGFLLFFCISDSSTQRS